MSSEELRLTLARIVETLCQVIRDETPSRQVNDPTARSGNDGFRAELVETVRKEFASVVKDGAKTGQRLERWMREYPDSIITQTMETESKIQKVLDILLGIDGGKNIGKAVDLVALYLNATCESIWESRKNAK